MHSPVRVRLEDWNERIAITSKRPLMHNRPGNDAHVARRSFEKVCHPVLAETARAFACPRSGCLSNNRDSGPARPESQGRHPDLVGEIVVKVLQLKSIPQVIQE
jgi:hypothetical protein